LLRGLEWEGAIVRCRGVIRLYPDYPPIYRGLAAAVGQLGWARVGLPVELAEPGADDANIRWTRELAELMRPLTAGSDYVN
jgi:hypothetical protein